VSTRFSSFTMVLPVYDEEARVARTIEYYRPFARLLAVDNFSSDRTAEIVRGLGVELVQHRNAGTIQTPEWMRHVAGLIETDYFALLSCSELIPVPLLERYDEVARDGSADVVSTLRRSYTCGELLPYLFEEYRAERFFNRKALDYDRVVIHGRFWPLRADRLLELPRDERTLLLHLRDSDAMSLVLKHAEYAGVEARHRRAQGERPRLARPLAAELLRLFRTLFAGANRIALREVWARMVMHTITWWIGWELGTGKGIEYSRRRSEELWRTLVDAQQAGRRDVIP